MKSFIEQAKFYAGYHQNKMTLYTHLVGVPLIILSLMIFLGFIQIVVPGVFEINFAVIGTVVILVYYYYLNWQLSLVLTPVLFFLLWIADMFSYAGPTTFSVWVFLITFIVGWGFQLYGHFIENKKPAFVDSACQALVAPLFLIAELFFMAGFLQGLKEQIMGKESISDEPKPTKSKAKTKK